MDLLLRGAPEDGAKVSVPSSKSLSHRYLLAASLSDGESLIEDLADNKDIEATMRCLKKRGVSFETVGNVTRVLGNGDLHSYDGSLLDAGESGTTLRFLLPLFAQSGKEVTFTGQGKLLSRPLSVYEDLYQIKREDDLLKVKGSIDMGEVEVTGGISSQFISGLLFLLPLLEGNSTLVVKEPFVSRSYVDLSLDVLRKAGIKISEEGNLFHIPGAQSYSPFSIKVEGDASQAAFFACLAYTSQKTIEVCGMNAHSRQGDQVFVRYLKDAGAHVEEREDSLIFHPSKLHGLHCDLEDCPDLGPVLFALAASIEEESLFLHTDRLRIKESDRVASMKEELSKMDILFKEENDSVRIQGKKHHGDLCFSSHNDHRIAMALSILSPFIDGGVYMKGYEAVNKSYPDFYQDLKQTGVEVNKL